MRIVDFVMSFAARRQDPSGVRVLPCRSAPAFR
jgi:hypothetical protein